VLAWVNDPDVSVEVLKDSGVHTRASKNIMAYRDGPDGIAGSEDDDYFADADELDDVYYVGKRAFEQMVAAVSHRCGHTPTAEVIFSPQSYQDCHLTRIVELINATQRSIDIAMYSFRDSDIHDALKQAVERGVSVRFIFESANSDRSDPAGSKSAKLEDIGIDVRYVNKIMHHKFAIFDGPRTTVDDAISGILATGSGNWSHSAGTRYDENTIIVTGCDELLLRFQKEFNLLWENSRDFTYTQTFEWLFSKTITEWMIPDIPVADAAFTSANFKTSVSSRYGPTFSVIRGQNEVSDVLVELIQNANSSIYIASGHLRSRPVAEALMARYESNPNMDIRVYLDGQEYISEWYQNEQDNDLEDCLLAADDSEPKQQDCIDKGYYFSYVVHQSGIPLRFKYYAYRWDYSYAVQMHHKYLAIDKEILASGSYNLSDNAEHNTMENMVIYHRITFPTLVDDFIDNFETLWITGESEGFYDDLVDLILNSTAPIPIVFDSMALDWDEVTYLKGIIRDNCPDINTEPFRTDPAAHQTCYR
jgi:phosphatidylserine/phosphatidylglycerophosphate/cardiolipin synthase-like enzyme